MPDYGLVARQINNLTNQIRSETAAERADKLAMSNLGLQQAQLGLQQRTAQGQQDIALAKAKKEQWESEPVTGMQFLQTLPGMTPEQLQQKIDNIHKVVGPENANALLNAFTHKRSDWLGAIERASNAAKEEKYRKQKLGLEKRKLDLMGQRESKDTRGSMQKDVEYIQNVRGGTPQAALNEYIKNKSLPERIRLYNNELNQLSEQFLPEQEKNAKVKQLRKAYGIDDLMEGEKEYLGNKIRMVYDPSTNKLVPK